MFRKSKLLFAFALISLGAKAQDSESIAALISNQGIALDVVSASKDQSTFAGISKENSSLFVAQKKIGNYKLPENIDTSLTEGAFRPDGFSENEYLYFSVYDASSFLTETKTLLNNSLNRVTSNCLSCSGYPSFVMNSFANNPRRSIATFGYYRPQRVTIYHRSNYSQTITSFGIKVQQVNKAVDLFTESNSILFFTENTSSLIRLNLDGTIASKTEIELKEPILWSNKGRGVVKDEIANAYYIFTETNFSYNWYKLDCTTGETQFITKMRDVWENPNFRIENGQLHYQKSKAGKLENYTLNLKN
ncbi:MAG: hypothetical protein FGM14_09205 [Flavobacteriales bacterium]|nr:hypothetical protein [Flavobacteriales bacterium]